MNKRKLHLMEGRRFKRVLVVLTIVLILMAMAAESVYFSDFEYRYRTKRFNKILKEKEVIMDECLNGMKPILAKGESHGSTSENKLFEIAEQNNITLLEYISNKLIYWSGNDFDVPGMLNDSVYAKPFIFMQNGWFLTKSVQAGNERIVALLRLYSEYGFENDIIKNGFTRDFDVPGNVRFSTDEKASAFRISSNEGTFLFNLQYPENKDKTFLIFVPLLLWGLSFILILYLILRLVKYLKAGNRNITALIVCTSVLSAIYFFILFFKKPAVLFQTEFFSPYRYTMNAFIPSLGHLSLLTILLSLLSYVFYIYLPVNTTLNRKRTLSYTKLTLLLIPGALLFALHNLVFSHLIFNSNINFETFKVLDMNLFSLSGFISITLLFGIPFLYVLKVFRSAEMPDDRTIFMSVITSAVVFLPLCFFRPGMTIALILFYLSVLFAVWITDRKKTSLFNKTVIYSLIFGLYSLSLISGLSEKKTEENIKIQLVTYSTGNDPSAEHLLLDMWPKLSADSTLKKMMNVEYFERNDVDSISDYLHDSYFTGYLGNFNFSVVLCMKNDSIRIGDHNDKFEDCFSFFEGKVLLSGHQLTGTGFYFIDNKQGRSNYLGRLLYDHGKNGISGLFIDLYNDVNVFQPGYSELLFDKKYHGLTRLRNYSFAKYINGELVIRTGDFPFNKTDAEYIDKESDYRFFKADAFRHVLYRNGNVTVILSRPSISLQDIIVSFAYLFVFVLLCSNLLLFVVTRPAFKGSMTLNFRQKLQLSFIGILLISFTLIAVVIATLAVRQYKTKHYENLKERLNSVYLELENRFSTEKTLSAAGKNNKYNFLDEVLVKLSNTFNTDINLYDLNEYLIATSRPEIFYRNLTSRRMNNMAYINLKILNKSEYFQREKIGNLRFITAYVPFYNSDNEPIAFLNLPYFRMQSLLSTEISNLIVTVINFTLLLIIIAMSLAVIISSRLTSPLKILSGRLASVELGKKSEHLSYNGTDEVGDLVRQYNRMVDEIEESTQKLANSEREYAWREMAKQIAHEIKNPLTPMKLNVQQLLKSWKDGVPGFEKKLERFTKNQIEYIDNLSSIASAFSSFAKIPEANPVEVDLIQQIITTLELFKNSENITFRTGWAHDVKYFIIADKEQVNSIFSNIIKNAIQSIPTGKEGIIKVSMVTGHDKIIVSVTDNGTGIPESLQKNMFIPNFTTKSSGTGLGLSIAKRYTENAGGKIWFESETNKGSVFYIEFPLVKAELMPGNGSPG